jgi:hypothetical protein
MRLILICGLFLMLLFMVLGMAVVKNKSDLEQQEQDTSSLLSPISSAQAESTEEQPDYTRYCLIEAQVNSIYKDYPLMEAPSSPEDLEALALTNITLALTKPQEEMDCKGYGEITLLRMNAVQNHAPEFQALQEGDIITGRLSYHRPSPHGKFLFPRYHNGLQMTSLKRDGVLIHDWSKDYIYFRHIEVEER